MAMLSISSVMRIAPESSLLPGGGGFEAMGGTAIGLKALVKHATRGSKNICLPGKKFR